MHDVRLLSVKHFMFRLLHIARGWVVSGADLQIPSSRNSASVGSVEKWVRANDMHCTCAPARACSFMVCFSAGHILPELRKFICAMKL